MPVGPRDDKDFDEDRIFCNGTRGWPRSASANASRCPGGRGGFPRPAEGAAATAASVAADLFGGQATGLWEGEKRWVVVVGCWKLFVGVNRKGRLS